MCDDHDRPRERDAGARPERTLRASGERAGEVGSQYRGGGDDDPVTAIQRQPASDQLGHRDHDRKPHGVAAGGRPRRHVGPQLSQLAPHALERPVGPRVWPPAAQAGTLARGRRLRRHRSQLPGQGREAARQLQRLRIHPARVRSGLALVEVGGERVGLRAELGDADTERALREPLAVNHVGDVRQRIGRQREPVATCRVKVVGVPIARGRAPPVQQRVDDGQLHPDPLPFVDERA